MPTLPAEVAAGFGLGRVAGCVAVAEGVMNLTWRLSTDLGTYAVKRLRDRPPGEVRTGLALLPRLARRGFPVAVPCATGDGDTVLRAGEYWYAASGWLPGVHPRDLVFDLGACAALGALVGRLHRALAEECPPAPPTMPDIPDKADAARADLARYEGRGAFGADEIAWRKRLLAEVADREPAAADVRPCGWTHGDLQPYNLLVDPADGRLTGLLDWDRLGVRPYGLEVVRTATIMFGTDLRRIAAFVRGYRETVEITDSDLADAAHRRWWTLATETWQLRRHYDSDDRSCDHLFVRRGAYLRWWTGHRAELDAALTSGDTN